VFQVVVFCVVMPCSVVVGYKWFRGPCCLHHHNTTWHHNLEDLGFYPRFYLFECFSEFCNV